MSTPTLAFSHLGIHVTDAARMEDFYTRVLGLLVSDRGTLPSGPTLTFLSHDPDEHHQIVLVTGRPPGIDYNVINQISFKVPSLEDLQEMHRRLREDGIKQFRIRPRRSWPRRKRCAGAGRGSSRARSGGGGRSSGCGAADRGQRFSIVRITAV